MISLTKTLILFFLMVNIVFVTCPPRSWFSRREKSRVLAVRESGESEFDYQVKNCKLEVRLLFQKGTGLENFLHALLNIDEMSLRSSENFTVTSQIYYEQMYQSAQEKNPPSLLIPQEFCHNNYYYDETLYTQCISTIEEMGCEANTSGKACILHLYLKYKKPDEVFPGCVPGTENLTDEDLSIAYHRGIDFPDEYTDTNLLEDYYKKTGEFHMLSENTASSSSISPSASYYSYPADDLNAVISGNYLRYVTDSYRISAEIEEETKRNNDLREARYRSYGIRDLPYASIRQEFRRRHYLPKMYGFNYAMYLHNEILNNSDWTFDNRHVFCVNYVQGRLNN